MVNYGICQTQGSIYELAATKKYDMKYFSEAYLQSAFCKKAMDAKYSRFQIAEEEECWEFLYPEIEPRLKISPEGWFDTDIAYWIGFTYRQLAIETEISSNILCQKVDFSSMCNYYFGLHTLDEEQASDIICEDHGFVKIKYEYPDFEAKRLTLSY